MDVQPEDPKYEAFRLLKANLAKNSPCRKIDENQLSDDDSSSDIFKSTNSNVNVIRSKQPPRERQVITKKKQEISLKIKEKMKMRKLQELSKSRQNLSSVVQTKNMERLKLRIFTKF